MIDQLLDFTRARLGPGLPMDRVSIDLRKVAERIVEETKQARPDAAIDFEASGNTVGEWDVELMEQVLSNLLGNAVDHGDGKRVSFTMTGEVHALRLRVHNLGEPISDSFQPHISDPFRQKERRHSGRSHGLGLGLLFRGKSYCSMVERSR